jgi:hypothetical protein
VHPGLIAAIVINTLLAITWLLWVPALLYAAWSTHYVARTSRWKPPQIPLGPVVQVKDEEGTARYCNLCSVWQADRMSHCDQLHRCLPHFDHDCVWWAGSIWAHNVKAYLVFLLFLLPYQILILAISIWVLVVKSYQQANMYIVLGVYSGLSLIVSCPFCFVMWRHIVVYNILNGEMGSKQVFVKTHSGITKCDSKPYGKWLWNLGFKANFRFILGPWWTLPLFWTTTPLLESQSQYPFRQDFPPPEIALRALDRRSLATSSGFDGDTDATYRAILSTTVSAASSN